MTDRKEQVLIKAGCGIALRDRKMANEGISEFIDMCLLEIRMDEAELADTYEEKEEDYDLDY